MICRLFVLRYTAFCILWKSLGWVEKAEAGHTNVWCRSFFDLTQSAVQFRRLQPVAHAVMFELLLRHSEMVNLGVLGDGQVAYIDVVQSPSALRIAANPGDRNPAHSTSLGKVILAYSPEAEVEKVLKRYPLVRMTSKTITQKAHLVEHLDAVREQGVAFDLGENFGCCALRGYPDF